MNPGLLLGLWQFVLEISARFLRICDPAAEGGQVVFIPSLGLGQVEGVLGVVPDVEEEVKNSLLGSRERDAIWEAGQIAGCEIRRQIALGHLVGDAMERGGYMTPLVCFPQMLLASARP